jgi:type VI secretion system secreted protein VgrG
MADKHTQANRPLRLTTPLGPDVLLLERFVGEESVSSLFRFDLHMLSTDPAVDGDKLLGAEVSVEIDFADGTRHFGGVISRFRQGERGVEFTRYRAEMVPRLWISSLTRNSRIFQELRVDEIAEAVLAGQMGKYSLNLTGSYEQRTYCTQYRESDLQFLSRLLEQEGIHYFFAHAKGDHELVIGDASQQNPKCPAGDRFTVAPMGSIPQVQPTPMVFDLEYEVALVSGKVELRDHNFQLQGKTLEADAAIAHGSSDFEVYDYPGEYATRFDGVGTSGSAQAGELQKIFDENRRVATIRARELDAAQAVLRGKSNCPFLTPGHRFDLQRHHRKEFNGTYFVRSVRHAASIENYEAADGAPFAYDASFEAHPTDRPFVPPRLSPPARVDGSQTAVVVGPSGSEIFADEYGRVKVQFNWDREGNHDDSSSCWIRVSTPWAGKQWGMIAIPRVGTEVVVDFLEGDPDRPLIVGMVYNSEAMPPYELPDNKTQAGIKTRSTLSGSAETYNELRFEDRKDAEHVYLHAERNFRAVVENDDSRSVGNHQLLQVKGARGTHVVGEAELKLDAKIDEAGDIAQGGPEMAGDALLVEKDRYTRVAQKELHDVESGHLLRVRNGNQELLIDSGNQATTLKNGNQKIELKNGKLEVEVTGGDRMVKVKTGKIVEEALGGIELKVGQNSIQITPGGITIKGLNVSVEANIQAEVKGLVSNFTATGPAQVKGAVVMIN